MQIRKNKTNRLVVIAVGLLLGVAVTQTASKIRLSRNGVNGADQYVVMRKKERDEYLNITDPAKHCL